MNSLWTQTFAFQTWAFGVESTIGVYETQRKDQLLFSEVGEQAEWGSAIYATDIVRTPCR